MAMKQALLAALVCFCFAGCSSKFTASDDGGGSGAAGGAVAGGSSVSEAGASDGGAAGEAAAAGSASGGQPNGGSESGGAGGAPEIGGTGNAGAPTTGSAGAMPVFTSSKLIDDMEDGNNTLLDTNGDWYVFKDSSAGTIAPPTGTDFTMTALVPTRLLSTKAAHVAVSGFNVWGAAMGFDFSYLNGNASLRICEISEAYASGRKPKRRSRSFTKRRTPTRMRSEASVAGMARRRAMRTSAKPFRRLPNGGRSRSSSAI